MFYFALLLTIDVVDFCFQNTSLIGFCGYERECENKRLLESTKDNFPGQLLDRPTRDEALLDLVVTSTEEIKVKMGSNHALVEFVIPINIALAKSEVRTLNIRRENFSPFKELLDNSSRKPLLNNNGSEQSWLGGCPSESQKLAILQNKKSGKQAEDHNSTILIFVNVLGHGLHVIFKQNQSPGDN